ncbi:MAG: 50S ribosomal protein L23 [Cyanothece sp. SIO2G6]|nr:50S ribosomal protein L23 [Cyanothece sp. SIO2G6]
MAKIAPRDLPDLLRRPLVTEKATILLEDNKYVFEVIPKATKLDVKAAVEAIFDVKVVKVNILNCAPQKKRVGKFIGYKPRYKKAIVTLAEEDSITLFPDL